MEVIRQITLPVIGHNLNIFLKDGGGTIHSDLPNPYPMDALDEAWNSTVSAIESLVLAHAIAGIDVQSEAYLSGLTTSLEAAANHLL